MEVQSSKKEIWKKHVTDASMHREGKTAYCRERGINICSLHYWQKKFQKPTRELSPFVAVHVEKAEYILPDPNWLGAFAAQLIRSLR